MIYLSLYPTRGESSPILTYVELKTKHDGKSRCYYHVE